jgi:hypothetical protein
MSDGSREEQEAPYGLIPYHPRPPSAPPYNPLGIVSFSWGLVNGGLMAALFAQVMASLSGSSGGSIVVLLALLILGGLVACIVALIIGVKALRQEGGSKTLAALGILLNLVVLLGTVLLCFMGSALRHGMI